MIPGLCLIATLGLTAYRVILHISKLKSIEGRFEVLHKNQKDQPQIVVDYAHTPDALENILKTLKVFKSKSIILIFGCGGDRDQGKRSDGKGCKTVC